MSLPPQLASVVCSECGAENVAEAARCWLCYAALSEKPVKTPVGKPMAVQPQLPTPVYPLPRAQQSKAVDIVFAVLTAATVGLVVLVGIGAFVEDASAGLGYLVLVTPALLATGVSVLRTQTPDGEISWIRAFATLMLSFLITVLVLVALAVAAVIALIALCFRALSG
jgi:hypothetical protein